MPDDADATRSHGSWTLRAWERRTGRPCRILTTGLAGSYGRRALPFGLSVIDVHGQPPSRLGAARPDRRGRRRLSVPDRQRLQPVGPRRRRHRQQPGRRPACGSATPSGDRATSCGAGIGARSGRCRPSSSARRCLLAAIVGDPVVVARRPDRLTLLVGLAVLALAFFVVPDPRPRALRVPVLRARRDPAAVSWRWRVAYVVLSVATFANMYVVLTTLYPDNPAIEDWLGIGTPIRSRAGVTIIALVHTRSRSSWALAPAPRRGARDRLDDELARRGASEPTMATSAVADRTPRSGTGARRRRGRRRPRGDGGAAPRRRWRGRRAAAPGAAARRPRPSRCRPGRDGRPFDELGVVGWFRDRLARRPIRAGPQRGLAGERGGRLDRLDLWFLVVARRRHRWRCARSGSPSRTRCTSTRSITPGRRPSSCRTGATACRTTSTSGPTRTWRSTRWPPGSSLWGEDHVSATSELGVPVRDGARRAAPDDPDAPRPGRGALHVATGTEVRTLRPARRGTLVATIPAPGVERAGRRSDRPAAHRRLRRRAGRDARPRRPSTADAAAAPAPTPSRSATVDGAGRAPARRPTTAARSSSRADDRLDARSTRRPAASSAGPACRAIADSPRPARAGRSSRRPRRSRTRRAAASIWRELLGGDDGDYEARLARRRPRRGRPRRPGRRRRPQGRRGGDRRRPAAGLEIDDVAAGRRRRPRTASRSSTRRPATELGTIDRSTAAPTGWRWSPASTTPSCTSTDRHRRRRRAYARSRSAATRPRTGRSTDGTIRCPALGDAVAYDAASQMVHVLGASTPDGRERPMRPSTSSSRTANAVYADARLPDGSQPAAVVDGRRAALPGRRPRSSSSSSTADGTAASVELGSHAFAWRLPGRHRRGAHGRAASTCWRGSCSAAGASRCWSACFVLADGMFFVQSPDRHERRLRRPVHRRRLHALRRALDRAGGAARWRVLGRRCPSIGVLLGLALASKWVAAYAIGGARRS